MQAHLEEGSRTLFTELPRRTHTGNLAIENGVTPCRALRPLEGNLAPLVQEKPGPRRSSVLAEGKH